MMYQQPRQPSNPERDALPLQQDELAQQEATDLPNREAMSLISLLPGTATTAGGTPLPLGDVEADLPALEGGSDPHATAVAAS